MASYGWLGSARSGLDEPHRLQMDGLDRLPHRFPVFHQEAPGRWQLGRSGMQVTARPWS
ncbi:hypothetical protein ACFXCZ_24305 [Streptomyces sp. NPDC059396]|uniref:hypothetical protein n=1 Tax=Streptomyces sp. NPDC059396 TaxID=3346819 RepID=UPI0036B085B0